MRSRNYGGVKTFVLEAWDSRGYRINKLRREKMADLEIVVLNTYYFLKIWL